MGHTWSPVNFNKNGKSHSTLPRESTELVTEDFVPRVSGNSNKIQDLITSSHQMRSILNKSVKSLKANSGSLVTVDEMVSQSKPLFTMKWSSFISVDHLIDTFQHGLAGGGQITRTCSSDRNSSGFALDQQDWEEGQPARSAISVPILNRGWYQVPWHCQACGTRFNQGDLTLGCLVSKSIKFDVSESLPVGCGS